jgi:hypothetical protein
MFQKTISARQLMMTISAKLPENYWDNLEIQKQDLDFLHNHLFELETPMTVKELVIVLVEERIRSEQETQLKKKKAGGKIYVPKDRFKIGDELTFPALEWKRGKVTGVRPGTNPEIDDFGVLTVEMDGGDERFFAYNLADHHLNELPDASPTDDSLDPQVVVATYGSELEMKLDRAFSSDDNLVRIAGRWFPRALLVDVNVGHLNLAEAVLDMAGGEPLPTAGLLKDVELPDGVNPKLAEFSLNYALQEDTRFDEVGSAGQVLWCLQRLEPGEVQDIPEFLKYIPIDHDRAVLTDEMLELEAQLDDELSEVQTQPSEEDAEEVVISLLYPHWRTGTLPVSARLKTFFPTAYESPRVRFSLVDGETGDRMPGWVVRQHRYVFGLREWYQNKELIPGNLIRVRHGEKPGEVIVDPVSHRSTRDWVRTVIVGADGGLVFALLKQVVTAAFNERMVIAATDVDAVDQARAEALKNHQSFDKLVNIMMRELTKLNPQGHVHAQELYSAVNIIRRCPPAPLLCLLTTRNDFVHVGDLHFRLEESRGKEVS